ncbi:glycine-rich domain-containing protein [Streptomyces erythrochromogenes]|uniref:glycine-rich domain-containing protein n=1 Tax=Streptomyces erythrochromogenes TaxID=285574 RepID=UPI0036A9D51E
MSSPYPTPPPCSTRPGNPAPPARATVTVPRLSRTLLGADEFLAVAMTVVRDNENIGWSLAERITVEALAFVATCAENEGVGLAPSPVVDEGWHALILHTELYADLQERLGSLVHHYPQAPEDGGYEEDVIATTLAAMRQAGFEPDKELWRRPMDNLITVKAETWHSPMCGPIKPMPSPQCLSDPKKTPRQG